MDRTAEAEGERGIDGVAGGSAEERAAETARDTPESVSTDVYYRALSSQRRRFVLEALLDTDDVTVRELTEYVAARECDVPVAALEYKERKRVYTSLVQTHLPMLHTNGVVAYEKDRGIVSRTPATWSVASSLDEEASTSARSENWHRYYLALAGVSGLLVGLAWVGVPPFVSVPPLAYAAVLVGTLAITGGIHRRSARVSDVEPRRTDAGPTRRIE